MNETWQEKRDRTIHEVMRWSEDDKDRLRAALRSDMPPISEIEATAKANEKLRSDSPESEHADDCASGLGGPCDCPSSTGGERDEPRYPGESDEAIAFRRGVEYGRKEGDERDDSE